MKKLFPYLLIFGVLMHFMGTKSYAQVNFNRFDAITVLNYSGDTLKNPWAGGFNSPQFSEVDIDRDGIKDIFVFDRTGNRKSCFINAGIPNQAIYTHAPEYNHLFPVLREWAILRDYNCDGKMDIFTYSSGGMAAYTNTSTTQLSFVLDTSLVYSDYQPDSSTPSYINLYISSADIPAIEDVDGDGDLDVLTFSIVGAYVVYHKNLSMEKYGTCDSLDFQVRNECWGFFKENLSSNSVTLQDTCTFNNANPERTSGGNKHAGSTLFMLDVNADNAKDLVLSDVSFSNFTLLVNGDTSPNLTESHIVSQDSLFPRNNNMTVKTDIDIFPAGFYFDVNNDNVRDLVAAPNCYNGCSNENNVWYYKNNGATNNPDFELVQTDFIQGGMIEVGEGAHPVFFDYNADGLTDIIVGNYGVHDPSVGPLLYESSLWLYENIGTATQPAFQLVDSNYAGIANMNLDLAGSRPTLGLAPTFGDMDGDNDLDMLLGDYNGYVHYFRNTAGPGNPANFVLQNVEYLGIDVGQHATPLLYDLNKDNLLDLIIGKEIGTFSYYENTGTASAPIFNLVTDSLGKAVTRRYTDFQGNSNPIFVDSSGTTVLYSGAKNGFIYKFTNIDGNLNGTFTADSSYNNIWEGVNSFVAIEDITNDGMLDLTVGNYAGGIAYYQGNTNVSVAEVPQALDNVKIYPNPTKNLLTIDMGNTSFKNTHLQVTDLLGKTLYQQNITATKTSLSLANYSRGIYLVKINSQSGGKVYKVIKE